MRAIIMAAGAALALAGCRDGAADGNAANVTENLAAEEIVVNDPTAIDAVSGEDSNLAVDAEIPDANELGNDGGNDSAGNNSD